MLKICVIGAGRHSQLFHLPALARYREHFPQEIALAAICDRDEARAKEAAAAFGFERSYQSVQEMLAQERPAACIAITPVESNAAVAIQLMRAGVPVLMEKPLGSNLAEAREVVRVAAETQARVMVSMNRRFDPALHQALSWIARRRLHYLRATMARHNRQEGVFLEETGLHIVDVIRMVVGEVSDWTAWTTRVHGTLWRQARLEFAGGEYGLVDILPTAGGNAELLELFGDGFRVEVRSAEFDQSGWRAWTDGRLVREESMAADNPAYIANGTYAETVAFLEGVIHARALSPTPDDVLKGMELCHALAAVQAKP